MPGSVWWASTANVPLFRHTLTVETQSVAQFQAEGLAPKSFMLITCNGSIENRPQRKLLPWSYLCMVCALIQIATAGTNDTKDFVRPAALYTDPIAVSQIIMLDAGVMSVPTVFSSIVSVANATVNISQIIYDFKAVGEQARDLLSAINHVSSTLKTIRTLRHQKATALTDIEKTWIDGVCKEAEVALQGVAALIEPARVDMQTRKSGRVSFVTRSMFVLRESPKVASNLARLGLVTQGLNAAVVALCNKDGTTASKNDKSGLIHLDSTTSGKGSQSKAPPSYEESEFINRRRAPQPHQKITGRKTETYQLTTGTVESADGNLRNATTSYFEEWTSKYNLNTSLECDAQSILSGISSAESDTQSIMSGTTAASPTFDPSPCFEGADGLQVVNSEPIIKLQSQSYAENEFLHRRRRVRPHIRNSRPGSNVTSTDEKPGFVSIEEEQRLNHQQLQSEDPPSRPENTSNEIDNRSELSLPASPFSLHNNNMSRLSLPGASRSFDGADGLQVVDISSHDSRRSESYEELEFLNRRRISRAPSREHQGSCNSQWLSGAYNDPNDRPVSRPQSQLAAVAVHEIDTSRDLTAGTLESSRLSCGTMNSTWSRSTDIPDKTDASMFTSSTSGPSAEQ